MKSKPVTLLLPKKPSYEPKPLQTDHQTNIILKKNSSKKSPFLPQKHVRPNVLQHKNEKNEKKKRKDCTFNKRHRKQFKYEMNVRLL